MRTMGNARIIVLGGLLALVTFCNAAVRVTANHDEECGWQYQGSSQFADLSGNCSKVMLADQDDMFAKGNLAAVKIVGQTFRLDRNRFVIENYDDVRCIGSTRRFIYPIGECVNLTASPDSWTLLGSEYAKLSVSNVTGDVRLNNDSNLVFASASYYRTRECGAYATPYPIRFVPGKCYKNATELFPVELSLLVGASYPPLVPLTAVRVTLSKGFLHFFSFVDSNCTVFRHSSQSLSYGLGACTVVSNSTAVLVNVNEVKPVAKLLKPRTLNTVMPAAAAPQEPEMRNSGAARHTAFKPLAAAMCLAFAMLFV